MSTNAIAPTKQGSKDIRDLITSPKVMEGFRDVATKYLTPDRLAKLVIAACHKKPELLQCTPESVLQCAMQCCQYGLEPDGRHAHFIAYGKQCTFQIDWKGIVVIGRRNGIKGIVPDTICANDEFEYYRDEAGTHFKHKPKFGDRGDIVGVYSICEIDGEFDVDVMTKDEVEKVRQQFSKAKDADAWKKSWPEMAKKTVLRRHSKRWPLTAEEAEAVMDGDGAIKPVVTIAKPLFPLPSTHEPTATEPEPTDVPGDPATAQPTMYAPQPTASTPQDELAEFVTVECTANFDQFREAAINAQLARGAEVDTWDGFESIPLKTVEKLLAAKAKLKEKLEIECLK